MWNWAKSIQGFKKKKSCSVRLGKYHQGDDCQLWHSLVQLCSFFSTQTSTSVILYWRPLINTVRKKLGSNHPGLCRTAWTRRSISVRKEKKILFYCVRRKLYSINEKCLGLKWKLDGGWIIKESEMCLHNSVLLWAWIPEQLCCDSGAGAKSIHYRCDVRTWRDKINQELVATAFKGSPWALTWSTIQHWMKSSNATWPFRCRSNFSISVP